MNINFPSVDDSYIKAKIEAGFYSNATELVRDAVRRMREQDASSHPRLTAALERGEQAIRDGRTVTYTPQLLAQIDLEAQQHAAEGRRPNPDVCP